MSQDSEDTKEGPSCEDEPSYAAASCVSPSDADVQLIVHDTICPLASEKHENYFLALHHENLL